MRPSCIQHCLPLNAWRASRPTLPCAGIPGLRFILPSCHLRQNTLRHDRLRPFHVAYGRSQRSMAGSPMRGLINRGSRSKHKFLQKALPPPLPWLAHLCSLFHTLPPLSQNLCSYYHPVTCGFKGYSSFLFSFGWGLGVHDPKPWIGIVICPLFPFWRAGRPVWKHSTAGSSIIFALMARGPSGPAYYFCCTCSCYGARPVLGASAPQGAQLWFAFVPLLARGPSGPTKHLPFLLYCSCFGARPVLGASAPQAAQLSFPLLLDFGASRPVYKRSPQVGGCLVILARMVTHAVTSMPKTAKMRMRSAPSYQSRWSKICMMHTKSCTKGTVVQLSQRGKRRMLDWRLFQSLNGWFFFVHNEKNAVWGKFDSCANRNYVLTDYVL